MFNEHVRDRLLFEDDEFTQSRRYFWAVLALEAIADDIHGLIVAYQNTFTDDVWTGNHKYIWPGTKESSSRHAFWRKRMLRLRNLFEKEIDALKELHAENELSQKKIRSLAEDMSRATNVYGARKNIEQQAITVFQSHNIKMLALVTIWFLPLIFVADIFGMTNMPAHGSFVHLAITLVCVCLPVYAFMGLLNTGGGFGSSYWKERFGGFKGRFKLSKTRPPPAAKFMYHDSQGSKLSHFILSAGRDGANSSHQYRCSSRPGLAHIDSLNPLVNGMPDGERWRVLGMNRVPRLCYICCFIIDAFLAPRKGESHVIRPPRN